MKKRTKIFISAGVVPLALVPVATTFAMSTSTADLATFYGKINTVEHSKLSIQNFEQLKQTQWFKDNYLTLKQTDREELFKSVIALIHSSEIKDEDKVDIAKLLQEHQSYLNFMTEFGFNNFTNIHQSNELNTQNQFLTFNGTTSSNVLLQNAQIKLDGATGINVDASTVDTNVISISNQDVINYFSLGLSSSSKFNELLKFVNGAKKQLLSGVTTLPQAWTTYIRLAKETLAPFIANGSVSETRIKAINLFKIFDTVDTSALSSDNDFFKVIMNSELGKYFHASDTDRSALINDFETNGDPDDKNMMSSNIFKSIETSMKSLINNKSTLMISAIMKTTSMINNVSMPISEFKSKEQEIEWTDLIAQMVKFSNGFSQGIEIYRKIDTTAGDVIGIKSGYFKENQPYQLQPSELRMRMENFDLMSIYNTVDQATYRNQELSQAGLFSQKLQNYVTHVIRDLNEWRYELAATPKAVMGVGEESDFQTSIKADIVSVDASGHEQVLKTVIFNGLQTLHENDHDNDDAIKNTQQYIVQEASTEDHWSGNYYTPTYHQAVYGTRIVPWTVTIPSTDKSSFTWVDGQIANQPKFFLRFHNGSFIDQTAFDDLAKSIQDAVTKEYNKQLAHINDIKAGKTPNDYGIDVTASHKIEISLQSITFGEVRFNTYDDPGYDDTHSDHFRFQKVSASFEVDVRENGSQ